MAVALENCVTPASSLKVGAWVESVAGDSLKERAQRLREAEESTGVNTVVDVEGLQKRLADAQLSFSTRDSDGRISIAAPGPRLARSGETATQPMAHSNWVRRERRSRWLAVSAALTVFLAALAALLLLRPHRAPAPARSLPSAQFVAPAPAPSVAPVLGQQVIVEPADLPQEPPAQRAPAPSAPSAPRMTRRAPKSRTPANCVPPYVLDAQGHKRFKPECF
jgi:serine/threonine-protein kinase